MACYKAAIEPAPESGENTTYINSLACILKNFKTDFVVPATEMMHYFSDFFGGLKESAAKIEEVSSEIAKVNTPFAMNLNDFSKDLKSLYNYYYIIYVKTKAMVEFGTSEHTLPHIKKLIEDKDYLTATDEIKNFLDILAKRLTEILEKLDENEVTKSEELNEKIKRLSEEYERSKAQMEEKVAEQKHRCYKIGAITLFLPFLVSGGMFVCGKHSINEQLELVRSYIPDNPELLNFITQRGIESFNAVAAATCVANELKITIEKEAQKMRARLYCFYKKVNDFQAQISIIISDIKELENCKEALQDCLKNEVKTVVEWENVATILGEMFKYFKHLEKEVVDKRYPWEEDPAAVNAIYQTSCMTDINYQPYK